MDTATIEDRSVEDLKEIITRMGGWPVVEGSAWKEDNFKWWDLSMRAAEEGFGTDRMISIGKNFFMIPIPQKFNFYNEDIISSPEPRIEEETKGRPLGPHTFSAKNKTKMLRLHNKSKGLRKKND